MTPALRQLRDGIRAHIAEDPTIVKVNHYPLIDDGYGNMVPDTAGTAEEIKARVRLQHESSGVQANQIGPSGLDTNLSLYVLTDHRAPLLEGDQFSALGFTWTVGPVNEFRRHGGMYKTEAPLSKGSAVGVTVPTDFAAEALSDTEIDLTWDDVGAVNTYQLERKTGEGDFALVASPAAGARVYHDTGLTAETEYVYRLCAYDGAHYSAYTAESSATTESTP